MDTVTQCGSVPRQRCAEDPMPVCFLSRGRMRGDVTTSSVLLPFRLHSAKDTLYTLHPSPLHLVVSLARRLRALPLHEHVDPPHCIQGKATPELDASTCSSSCRPIYQNAAKPQCWPTGRSTTTRDDSTPARHHFRRDDSDRIPNDSRESATAIEHPELHR